MAETISTPPVRMDMSLKDTSIMSTDLSPVALLQNSPLAHTLRRLKHESANGGGSLSGGNSDSTDEASALDAGSTTAGSVSTSSLLNSGSLASFRCERCDNFETTSRASLLLHVVQCLSNASQSASSVQVKGEDGAVSGGEQNNNSLESENEQSNAAHSNSGSQQNGNAAANGSSSVASSGGSNSSRKVFECDVCNMKFSNGANMRRHKMRHTGVKPYECRVCQKR